MPESSPGRGWCLVKTKGLRVTSVDTLHRPQQGPPARSGQPRCRRTWAGRWRPSEARINENSRPSSGRLSSFLLGAYRVLLAAVLGAGGRLGREPAAILRLGQVHLKGLDFGEDLEQFRLDD